MFLQVFLKSDTLNIRFLIQTEPKRKIYAAWWESEVGARQKEVQNLKLKIQNCGQPSAELFYENCDWQDG